MSCNIKLKILKEFTVKEMKEYPVTRDCILAEPGDIPGDVFLTKLKLWLSMLKIENEAKSR